MTMEADTKPRPKAKKPRPANRRGFWADRRKTWKTGALVHAHGKDRRASVLWCRRKHRIPANIGAV